MAFYAPHSNPDQMFIDLTKNDDDEIPQNDESRNQHDQNGEEWFEEQLEADLKWSFALNRYVP